MFDETKQLLASISAKIAFYTFLENRQMCFSVPYLC